ncbi:MAG: DNA/RNA non-specific endonuclease [Burkholderiaceae bacterium]
MRSLFLLAATLTGLASAPAAAQFSRCSDFFLEGRAPVVGQASPEQRRELCFSEFAVLHSGQAKTPILVAYKLNRERLEAARAIKRRDRFYEEARLPARERATLADYKSRLQEDGQAVRFDRGHMAPAAIMATREGMAQSFSLANMVPQAPRNNQGIWANAVEGATRQYAARAKGDVYVITGSHFGPGARRLGPSQVWVPTHLYKLVHDAATGRSWAYWVENSDSARMSKPIDYAELVRRTGIDFLPRPAAR